MFRNITLEGRGGWQGEVVSIDRFGNIITSFDASMIAAGSSWTVSAGVAQAIPFVVTYGDVQPGQPLAYIGSSGMIEIAVRNGNACCELGIDRESPVCLLEV